MMAASVSALKAVLKFCFVMIVVDERKSMYAICKVYDPKDTKVAILARNVSGLCSIHG